MGGIPPPSKGLVGKNRSTRSKTTVKSKRGVSPKVKRGPQPLYLFPTVLTILVLSYLGHLPFLLIGHSVVQTISFGHRPNH